MSKPMTDGRLAELKEHSAIWTEPGNRPTRLAECLAEVERLRAERNTLITGMNEHTVACFAERNTLRARVTEREDELRTVLDHTQSDQDIAVEIATSSLRLDVERLGIRGDILQHESDAMKGLLDRERARVAALETALTGIIDISIQSQVRHVARAALAADGGA